MKNRWNTMIAIAGAILSVGLAYPEMIVSEDTVAVEDEEGNIIDSLNHFSSHLEDRIEEIYNAIQDKDTKVEYRFRFLSFFNDSGEG